MRKKMLTVLVVFFLVGLIQTNPSHGADPYVVGFQTDITGPAGGNLAPVAEGFRLYMETINEAGGINGHPVKVIYEDDKSAPSRAAAIATKLCLEDKVLLIGGLSLSHSQPPVYEVSKKYKVPLIIPFSTAVNVFDMNDDIRYIFASGPVLTPQFNYNGYAQALALTKLFPKGSTVGSMSYTTPGGRSLSSQGARFSAMFGYKVVYHEDVPIGTPDVSQWAQNIAQANPDVMLLTLGGETTIPFLTSLEKMGYNKAVISPNYMSYDDFIKALSLLMKPKENIYYYTEASLPPGFAEKAVPEYTRMEKAMQKYGGKYKLTPAHSRGWLTARVAEEALKKAGWPATTEKVLEALEKTDLDTLGLTGGPMKFTRNDHCGNSYVKAYRWDPNKKLMVDVVDWLVVEPAKAAKQLAEEKK